MEELNLPDKFKHILKNFLEGLKSLYQEELISLVLYGSAASGEFVDRHSNLNALVILKNTDLENLKKASCVINKFRMLNPLFLTENYIASSTDIFPIEFLDIKENYQVLYGKDVLKDINIDTRNLRFQCEQELKAKLIHLRQLYLKIHKDKAALRNLLFKSFTSVLHILRNVLRLKGKKAPYRKQDILSGLTADFQIDAAIWQNILAAKNRELKLSHKETEDLFVNFSRELEKMVDTVDRL